MGRDETPDADALTPTLSPRERGTGEPAPGSAPAPSAPAPAPAPAPPPAPAGPALPPGATLAGAVEAILLVSNERLTVKDLERLLDGAPRAAIAAAIRDLREEHAARVAAGRGGLEIVEVAGGYRLVTRPAYGPWVERVETIRREERLSRAALETLTVVAYRQPIGRAEIDAIRGVDSSAPLGRLVDHGLVKVVGRAETPGRPLLYGTTPRFLERFGLGSLKDLPRPPARDLENELPRVRPDAP